MSLRCLHQCDIISCCGDLSCCEKTNIVVPSIFWNNFFQSIGRLVVWKEYKWKSTSVSVCVRRVGSKCVDGSWRHSSAVPLVSRYNWLPWAGDGHLPRKRHHAKMLSKESTANCVAMQPARFSHSSQWHLWITDSRTYWRYMVWLSACLSLHSHWGIAWTWQPAHLKRLNQIIICARMVKYLMWDITFLEFLSIFLLDLPASLMKNGQKMRYGSRWNYFGGKNTKS